MKNNLSDEIRLRHILDSIKNIENFSSGRSKEDLYDNLMYRSSIERQLEIIGEAANNLTASIYSIHSHIPWQKIISFRNFIAHEYFGLDLELIWDVITNKIPDLKSQIEEILQ